MDLGEAFKLKGDLMIWLDKAGDSVEILNDEFSEGGSSFHAV
jgi:hypothetical protein